MKEKEAQHAAEKQERVLAAFQKLLENVWGERSRLTQSGMTATKKDGSGSSRPQFHENHDEALLPLD
jgi:hypothetical protein